MIEKQPNALRLAEMNEKSGRWESAAELRILHGVNADLMDALRKIAKHSTDEAAAYCANAAITKATGE